jgi:hypothetical protein
MAVVLQGNLLQLQRARAAGEQARGARTAHGGTIYLI